MDGDVGKVLLFLGALVFLCFSVALVIGWLEGRPGAGRAGPKSGVQKK